MTDCNNIPQELKSYPNWICFRFEFDEKHPEKPKKVPINPRTGGRAMSNNPDTWADFDTALAAVKNYDGLGFMFSGSPFFGVDLDHKEKELEEYKNGAQNVIYEFLTALESYTELSPSGTGIHIICRGSLPDGRRRHGDYEMYDSGRFFTVTGNRFGDCTEIRERTEEIKPLHAKYLGNEKAEKPKAQESKSPRPTAGTDAGALSADESTRTSKCPRPTAGTDAGALSADDVLTLAMNAVNGAKFVQLYSGDVSGYPSHSEADMALCSMLAFWTRRDAGLMDVLFRNSGLWREKWDRPQSGSTYGALTIQKAISDCQTVYEPRTAEEKSAYRVSIGDGRQKLYTMDDMGNAARFIDLFGDNIRYNYVAKKWLYWDEKRWRTDDDGAAERMTDRAVEAMKAELKVYEQDGDEEVKKAFQKHIKSSRSNKSKANMLREVCHLLPVLPRCLDTHPFAFNTPSGIVSLRSGEQVPHDRKYMITKIAGAAYGRVGGCPLWSKFLDEIFGGDKELTRYIQKAVGYSLTGSVQEQCMFILLGDGHNGKSTFLEVLRDVFGDYCANIQAETIMVKNGMGSGINSDIARLANVRLVTSSEPNEGVRLNEGLIKQLTGGDPVTARKLFENEFEFHPEFKLWLAANHKPVVRGTDGGIWRRLHIIPFNVRIPPEKADKQLKTKLKGEYPEILRWAVEGCRLWQSEGLSMPKAVYDAVKEYRREMDVVSAFLGDRCEVREGAYVKASDLYAVYSAWCSEGNEYRMSNTRFGTEVAKKFKKVKNRDGVFYIGLKLSGF